MPPELEIATATFDRVRRKFPHLTMRDTAATESVDLGVVLPVQPGLLFDVVLSLFNEDELHLTAGAFSGGWFPCTSPVVARIFFENVVGLLSGRFRILEYRCFGRIGKTLLQRPHEGRWHDLYRGYESVLFAWFANEIVVVQNTDARRSG